MRLQTTLASAEAMQLLLRRFRWNIDLLGIKDGINTRFSTPETFIQEQNVVIRVYLNGQRLREGIGNDYRIEENGSPGPGFNTILLDVAPLPDETLTADYITA